jgi:hypothetical protein
MSNNTSLTTVATPATNTSLAYRLGQWIQDPMVAVIAASTACIGAFGLVLAGSWAIHMVLN